MTSSIAWLNWVASLIVIALTGWVIAFAICRRLNLESLDVIPERFQPAPSLADHPRLLESRRDGGAVPRSEIEVKQAHLVAKLENSGSKPLSIDQIIVFDRHRRHKYAVFQEADLRLDRGDSKTVEVKIPPFEGVRYVTPPEGGGMIEVITDTQTFQSEPFRFSDLVWGGSGSAGAERAA
jgi:hypothetical protein